MNVRQTLARVGLALSLLAFTGVAFAQSSTAAKPAQKPAAAKPAAVPKLDLNSAAKADLMKLPGIGDAIADKIIAARPFARKDELVQKKIVSQSEYDKIKDQIVATQAKKTTSTSKTPAKK